MTLDGQKVSNLDIEEAIRALKDKWENTHGTRRIQQLPETSRRQTSEDHRRSPGR
jgi:hypothetical protein